MSAKFFIVLGREKVKCLTGKRRTLTLLLNWNCWPVKISVLSLHKLSEM